MGNLYDDLLSLQTIPTAYTDWAGYREWLTGFILEQTDPHATACIVGAGACNDFDLRRLSGHFDRVLLLDRNTDAMRKGVERQSIRFPEECFIQADLLGIPDETYRSIADHMLSAIREQQRRTAPDAKAVERLFLREMDAAYMNRQPDRLMEQSGIADYVICCGVHSQLLTMFPQMVNVYRRYIDIRSEAIEQKVRRWIPGVMAELNDALFLWARKGVIVGLEEYRIGEIGGIDGASQALDLLQKSGYTILAQSSLRWDFDPKRNKAYQMRIMRIEP
ncbi:MAG: hypothetical protein IKG32_10280 [Clostridia bacterium]|nr:hypothetical protein [Clostridia bacterium]